MNDGTILENLQHGHHPR